ncbi:MAG TPA: hypothetical protein VEI96_12700 [Thermodesulfovibrionales bacterium]|nr:hypothetical protein [Thermodesulfovibrionales bacterium]
MKKVFIIGCIAGGILGVTVALSMDFFLGGAIGSGWRDAVAHDLGALFGRQFGKNSLPVITGVVVVVGFIGAVGSFLGGIFGVMIATLFSLLTKGHQG